MNKVQKKTIQISHWDSTCGNCKQGAMPSEGSHKTVIGYGVENGTKGCGVTWKYMFSPYSGEKEILEEQFPQYEYTDKIVIF